MKSYWTSWLISKPQSLFRQMVPGLVWGLLLFSLAAADEPSLMNRSQEATEVFENSIGMRFIRVPPGEFLMGSPETEPNRFACEQQHRVRLTKAFWLGMEEVSTRQFKAVTGRTPEQSEDDKPQRKVSWHDANDYCRRLSEVPAELSAGRSYRLPTEAEWEYACRAGSQTIYSWGDAPESSPQFAWSLRNSERSVKRSGSRQPNAWGFYDLHGSVWEWCSDWYADLPAEEAVDPQGPPNGDSRVVRGGAYDSADSYLRSASRVPVDPAYHSPYEGQNIGFRVVLMVEPDTSGKALPTSDGKN